jgi:hypothetical protein
MTGLNTIALLLWDVGLLARFGDDFGPLKGPGIQLLP